MLSIIGDVFRISTFGKRWDAPDHWRKRGPRSDWEIAREDWERNRRHYLDRAIR